jgi:hypothetical protein
VDTCCFGDNCFVLSIDQSQSCQVSGFLSALGIIDTPIASVAIAYDDPISYTTYILVFHQVLLVKGLEHNLLSPYQIRSHGMEVNNNPLSTLVQHSKLANLPLTSHSIILPDYYLQIPLKLRGVMSHFESRVLTASEIHNPDRFPQVVLTGDSPVWDPYDPELMKVEEELHHALGLVDFNSSLADRRISSCHTSPLLMLTHTFDSKFLEFVNHRECFETTSIGRKGTISVEDLAKRWRIGLNQARHTIDKTTQLAFRDFSNTLGERRIRPSNRQLKYRRFDALCYTDTLFGPCDSLTNHFTCAQVFVTEFDWTVVYPMKSKADQSTL